MCSRRSSSGGSPRAASLRTVSTSSSVTDTAPGSPSYSESVVPSSSIPSQGTAKATRSRGSGTASAACQSFTPGISTCTPLLSRVTGAQPGCSSMRTRSTQGPAAFTARSKLTSSASPPTRTWAKPFSNAVTSA